MSSGASEVDALEAGECGFQRPDPSTYPRAKIVLLGRFHEYVQEVDAELQKPRDRVWIGLTARARDSVYRQALGLVDGLQELYGDELVNAAEKAAVLEVMFNAMRRLGWKMTPITTSDDRHLPGFLGISSEILLIDEKGDYLRGATNVESQFDVAEAAQGRYVPNYDALTKKDRSAFWLGELDAVALIDGFVRTTTH